MDDTLIPVRKADIVIGKPLPWAVYDANHVLLLNKGVVVSSEFQLQTLIEKGLYREGRPRSVIPSRASSGETSEQAEQDEGIDLPFERVRLSPGDVIQLQAEGMAEHSNVRVIGMLRGKSLLVTHPVIDDKLIYVREGQGFLVRAFSGVYVCAFHTHVLKAPLTPYPYLHLSYPTSVHAVRLRKSMRAPVDIIVAIYAQEGGELIASGRIIDLSVGGAKLQSPVHFGDKGSRVFLSFKVKLDEIEEIITAPAYIRSLNEEIDDKGKRVKVAGLQFGELTPPQRLTIMGAVYQHLLKEV